MKIHGSFIGSMNTDMPTYEYECGDCGHRFDVLQLTKKPKTHCPVCGSSDTVKQITAPAGFQFKGPGFYATDGKGNKDA